MLDHHYPEYEIDIEGTLTDANPGGLYRAS